MVKKEEIFIFAICYNCGIILKKCLETFFKFHPKEIINVFGTYKDFKYLKGFENNLIFHELSADDTLKQCYKQGHMGTAHIITKVLQKGYGDDYSHIIHFDSDVIFRDECIVDIVNGFDEGFDLVGQRRPYEKNKCGRTDFGGLPDVVGTCLIGVNVNKISNYDFETLKQMVVGYYNPIGNPILDFFDPICFDMLKNGAKIKYLDYNDYGCANEEGSWNNIYGELNNLFDFGRKFVHFGGIGSGESFCKNGSGNVPDSYVNWAKSRYSMYMKLFYGQDIGVKYDTEIYNKLKKQF
jgi:hypothetical protein